MNIFYVIEKGCIRLRQSQLLRGATPLWRILRPIYDGVIRLAAKRGLTRNMNGTDEIRLLPQFRCLAEVYEPEVWQLAMSSATPGGNVIDLGAHIGLYAIALARRVGAGGSVLAFEPDPSNVALLSEHVRLNELDDIIRICPCGAASSVGPAFLASGDMQSSVSKGDAGEISIRLTTLDEETVSRKWDLLLIDVEGFEEEVLKGGRLLLADSARRPSKVIIEVHPYAWGSTGTTSESLLCELSMHGYSVTWLDGSEIVKVDSYGHIVAEVSSSR